MLLSSYIPNDALNTGGSSLKVKGVGSLPFDSVVRLQRVFAIVIGGVLLGWLDVG
jgi:hypothetical protein